MGNLGPGTKFTFENLGTHLKAQESAWLTDSKKNCKKKYFKKLQLTIIIEDINTLERR